MDTYIAALESFDKELGDIYFDYQMQSFVGLEAAGIDFKAKLRAGWDKLVAIGQQILKAIQNAIKFIGDNIGKLINMIRRAPETAETNADLEGIKRDLNDTFSAACDVLDEAGNLIGHMDDDGNFVSADEINDLNEKFNQATGKAANESYVAMEANMRTVRISDIKNFFGNLLKNGRAKLSELGNLTNKVQQLLNRHKSNTNNAEDATGETKKQSAFSKMLQLLARIGKFFRSIPSRVTAAWRAIFKRPEKQDYDGPNPMEGGEVEVG